MKLNFSVPCLFGLEGLVADELRRLEHEDVRAENGRVLFRGASNDIAKANINLRTGERVLLTVGETPANSFDELFEGVRSFPWEDFIPKDGEFPVKGHSLGSKLHSIPDCQRIIKKAVVERLRAGHKTEALTEKGEKYGIQFAIMSDVATLHIDTSGTGLHKRGYRPAQSAAPLRETLAAAIVKLSRYRGKEQVLDPFCGSGTIPIEAALAALNRAPGLNRSFSAEKWAWLDKKIWEDTKKEAKSREFSGKYDIIGTDIDPRCIEISKENAERAGVSEYIRFEVADATAFRASESERGTTIMTNPPYGERVMEQREVEALYRGFGKAIGKETDFKIYILSSHPEFEQFFGKRAKKKRKLYNGMIKCDLYMYF
ncbi:MAG: class I SAM-dependent RNA methyltransferase [Oscillospiraceae bacterium]|nr:class I SAM-dependent RNA methyltransferase [Oscillospiraceae bacterium]MCL2279163.1 class I SAM-dependent RNA methyltransferase [Oscillospiraceae bacterium]